MMDRSKSVRCFVSMRITQFNDKKTTRRELFYTAIRIGMGKIPQLLKNWNIRFAMEYSHSSPNFDIIHRQLEAQMDSEGTRETNYAHGFIIMCPTDMVLPHILLHWRVRTTGGRIYVIFMRTWKPLLVRWLNQSCYGRGIYRRCQRLHKNTHSMWMNILCNKWKGLWNWGRVEFAPGRGAIHLHLLGIAKDKAYLDDFYQAKGEKRKVKVLEQYATETMRMIPNIQLDDDYKKFDGTDVTISKLRHHRWVGDILKAKMPEKTMFILFRMLCFIHTMITVWASPIRMACVCVVVDLDLAKKLLLIKETHRGSQSKITRWSKRITDE